MKKPTTILIAATLLIGAGALIWWKTQPSVPPSDQSTENASANHNSRIANRKSKPSRYTALTDSTLSQHTRLELARSIDTHLTPAEADFLLSTFTHTPPSHGREQWWLILNEIMEQMRKKGVAPAQLGPALTSLIKDPQQTEVVRDYAIQHLSQWIAPPTPGIPAEPSLEAKSNALSAISASITDASIAHTSIPGTALMALTANSAHLPPELTTPMWQKLDPALTTMLKGETHGSLSTKTTIIQSVALRGSRSHLPLIQQYARDEKADPSLRLSSIAALGIYRSEEDRQYLQQIATGSTRYRHAAQSALKKLSD